MNKKFLELYESLLMEMPYVDVVQHGEHIMFDLELERYAHNLESFKNLLRNVLNSGAVTDKYGNEIQLNDHDEKVKFLSSLNHSSVVSMFLKKYHNTTLTELVRHLNQK